MAEPTTLPSDPFSPFVASDADPFDQRKLCHLLRRAAFGPTVKRLDDYRGKGVSQVLDALFEFDPADDPFESSVESLEGFVNFTESRSVASYWFYRMINSPHPLQERVALFWHNRFATSAAKVDNGRLMHGQIQLFRSKGLGNFRELAVAVGRDPAMLIWLDGQFNRKGKPNENYAREVMELFTLGIGNYTERDVKELARCFTGWSVKEEQASFEAKQFDDGEKDVLGHKGKFDSESAVDVLLAQPAASRLLAKNLLCEFVHPQPADEHVDHYAQRVVANEWNVGKTLREMMSSRLFFSEWAYRSRIKGPVELAVGAALAIGGKANAEFLRDSCQRLGQNLLYPPNVKGWPGDKVWINANTVLLRFNFAMQMATQRQREFVRRDELSAWLKQHDIRSADGVLEHFAALLLDGDLPPDARRTLLDYMNRDTKNELATGFKLTPETINSKVRGLMHMMMTMPEYQLA
jgi:uncharacterized protein (DUF1800 family)